MQHEPQQPKKAAIPQTRDVRGADQQPAPADPAAMDLLQRTIGNRAVGALLGGSLAQPPANGRAAINAIVQRHPIASGVHTAHGPKDKRHTPEEASAALVETQEEWNRVGAEVALDVVPKRLNKTNSVMPKLTAMQKYVEARLSIAESAPIKATRQSLRLILEDVQKRMVALKVRVEDVDRAAGYDDALALADSVPTLLTRVETNARAGAEAVKLAVDATSPKEAKAQYDEVRHDLSGAAEITERIAVIETSVAKHANLLARVQAYKVAAEAAVHGLRTSKTAVEQIYEAWKPVEAAQKTLDATRRLAANVKAAEKLLNRLNAMLTAENEYMQEFTSTLKGVDVGFSSGFSAEGMLAERRAYMDALTEARDKAVLALQAARDAAARIPAEEQTLSEATAAAPPGAVGAATGADTELGRLDDLQALRALAGGQPALVRLQASIPDKAKLKGLLEAIGPKLLTAWLADGLIGSVKAVALYDGLTGAGLKQFIADIGVDKRDAVMRAFSAAMLVDIHDDTQLGVPTFVELLTRYNVAGAAKMVTSMTLVKVKALTDAFTDTELSNTTLTADQLVNLHTKFTAVKLKHWYTIFGHTSISDFLTKFTAATLDTFITGVGEPRFEVLVRDKELNANALHHYGAPFLKDFVGVNGASMNHLTSAHTKADGVISGGHTVPVFTAELNRVIRPAVLSPPAPPEDAQPAQSNGEITAELALTADYRKVSYRTFNTDGSDRGAGSKTLILTLPAQPLVWQQRGDQAVWASIRALNCAAGDAGWNGSSDDGHAFRGFLSPNAKSVATFYPV